MPTIIYIELLEDKLEEEKARNALFEMCLERGLKLWQAEHPEADYWIDGSQNIKWLLEKIYLLEKLKSKRYGQALKFLSDLLDETSSWISEDEGNNE